jgi:hypothetical protein
MAPPDHRNQAVDKLLIATRFSAKVSGFPVRLNDSENGVISLRRINPSFPGIVSHAFRKNLVDKGTRWKSADFLPVR